MKYSSAVGSDSRATDSLLLALYRVLVNVNGRLWCITMAHGHRQSGPAQNSPIRSFCPVVYRIRRASSLCLSLPGYAGCRSNWGQFASRFHNPGGDVLLLLVHCLLATNGQSDSLRHRMARSAESIAATVGRFRPSTGRIPFAECADSSMSGSKFVVKTQSILPAAIRLPSTLCPKQGLPFEIASSIYCRRCRASGYTASKALAHSVGSPSGGNSDVCRKKASILSIQTGSAVSISRFDRFVSRQNICALKSRIMT